MALTFSNLTPEIEAALIGFIKDVATIVEPAVKQILLTEIPIVWKWADNYVAMHPGFLNWKKDLEGDFDKELSLLYTWAGGDVTTLP